MFFLHSPGGSDHTTGQVQILATGVGVACDRLALAHLRSTPVLSPEPQPFAALISSLGQALLPEPSGPGLWLQ